MTFLLTPEGGPSRASTREVKVLREQTRQDIIYEFHAEVEYIRIDKPRLLDIRWEDEQSYIDLSYIVHPFG